MVVSPPLTAGMSLMGRTANVLTYAATRAIQHFITNPAFAQLRYDGCGRLWEH